MNNAPHIMLTHELSQLLTIKTMGAVTAQAYDIAPYSAKNPNNASPAARCSRFR